VNSFAPHLEIEALDGVRVVKLNHPSSLNAVDFALHTALTRVWASLAEDPDARVVVLAANGRAFCAGGDMDMFQQIQADPAKRGRVIDEALDLVDAMLGFPLPVVAAVQGAAVGLGASLAVLSDIVFMGESAYMSDPHVAVGLTAGDGGPLTWPFLTSLLRVKEFLFTGDRIPAEQAVALGLANRVVPDGELYDHAVAYARRLEALPPIALRTTKKALNMHIRQSANGLLEYAFAAEYQCFDTDEHRQLVSEFVTRRSR
jgi:enoyl-CoA hydratase